MNKKADLFTLMIIIIALVTIVLVLVATQFSWENEVLHTPIEDSTLTPTLTPTPTLKPAVANQVVKDLGIGWNLGNTLDAFSNNIYLYEEEVKKLQNIAAYSQLVSKEIFFETLWGNPVTTKNMIDKVKEAGYGAVRIPITYFNHMDENGIIDQAWLQRVEEVVNYVLVNDMYCVINMHHDTGEKGWLRADMNSIESSSEKFKNAWLQISKYFKAYDEKLLFEGYNEILNCNNQWSQPGNTSYKAANQLNQIFVDTVRSTGGINGSRCLIVNTYAASSEEDALNHFQLPQDTIIDHMIVGVHYYGSKMSDIESVLSRLNGSFVSYGIPVIIGEYGTNFQMPEEERILVGQFIVKEAKKYNITCFWWDDGNYDNEAGAQCDYALLDKCALKWHYPALVEAMIDAAWKSDE